MTGGQSLHQTTNPPQPSESSYVTTHQPSTSRNVRPIQGMKYFAIATMVIAFLLAVLGIIAIVLGARASYLGNPIGSAILFVLPTGILGMVSYWKRTSFCVNISYLVICIILCLTCFQLMVFSSVNAANETWYCAPQLSFRHYDYDYCDFDPSGRISVDALIAVLALTQLVLCIVSLAFTCNGTFLCCQPTPPAVVQYFPQNGTCQLLSVGGYQFPTSYQPVSLMVPVGQGGQMMASALPVMAQTQMQPQTILLAAPNPASTASSTQANPAAAGNQPATPTPAPSVTEKMTDPLSEPAQTPDESLSYGQTATDYFHEERNLLDAV